MPAENVDVVFVLDASGSMSSCFRSVVQNIESMLLQFRQVSFKFRLDAVIHDSSKTWTCFNSSHRDIYHPTQSSRFFTSDVNEFNRVLSGVSVGADEDMLYALDCALDFPFGPVQTTNRVVVMFSDEPFEGNVHQEHQDKLDDLVEKIEARRIKFFLAMPRCDGAEVLENARNASYTEANGSGLSSFDFSKFFDTIGKTVTRVSAQMTGEPSYNKALFGQDR